MDTYQPAAPMTQDRDVLAANQAKAVYDADMRAIRANISLSDIAKARAITERWQQANAAVSAAYQRLTDRINARMAELVALIPFGVSIPDDASPADREVLQASFRHLTDRARNAEGIQGRRAMLAEAHRYADDMQTRAVMSVADELGERLVIEDWAKLSGQESSLAELDYWRGDRTVHATIQQAFRQVPKPPEANDLPQLESIAEAAEARASIAARAAEQVRMQQRHVEPPHAGAWW